MAGYSGTPLAKKLGIKAGASVALINAPDRFENTLDGLPDEVAIQRDPRGRAAGGFNVIVLFVNRQRDLRKRFGSAARKLDQAGGLWIAWPKKASGVATDLHEGMVRETGLAAGLVDNKICAIDDVWSGLRFVIRVKDRR